MKPKHQRLLFVVVSVACLITAVIVAMKAFRENFVYFYSPSDVAAQNDGMSTPSELARPARQMMTPYGGKSRVGGLVKEGSVKPTANGVSFLITDGKYDVRVFYKGMLPNLFREGQGVIAEGLVDGMTINATTILAKHDENYMPKEVVESLKKSGHWESQYAQ